MSWQNVLLCESMSRKKVVQLRIAKTWTKKYCNTISNIYDAINLCLPATEDDLTLTKNNNSVWATVTSNSLPHAMRPLSCLSVTMLYCGQVVGCIKMPLGTEVGLSPGDTVLDGDQAHPQKGTKQAPHFSAHVYCGQTVAHLSNCCVLVCTNYLIANHLNNWQQSKLQQNYQWNQPSMQLTHTLNDSSVSLSYVVTYKRHSATNLTLMQCKSEHRICIVCQMKCPAVYANHPRHRSQNASHIQLKSLRCASQLKMNAVLSTSTSSAVQPILLQPLFNYCQHHFQ